MDTESSIAHGNWRRDLAVLGTIVVVCAIPFLSQPFHMDDNFYMDMARSAQQNPLFPNDIPYMFQGTLYSDIGSHTHPPLQTYFLAAIQRFFGEGPGKEWIYHLAALIFPCVAVFSFYFICMRWLERPLWPSILLACSPLFLVMQHTLMTDIPTLAFWLGAIGSFLWATDTRRVGLYAASALFQTAAMFTSYQSFALVPLLGFYHWRKGGRKKAWIWLTIAPALVLVWLIANSFHYRRFLFGWTMGFLHSRHPLAPEVLAAKLLSVLEYQGWLILFPFFIFYLFARGVKGRGLMLALLGAAYIAQLMVPEYRLIDKAIFILGLAAGFFVVLKMGAVAWGAFFRGKGPPSFAETEQQFIGLWYSGVLFYCVFFLTEGSARYVLPLIPPFLVCYFRCLEIAEASEYRLPARLLSSAMQASGSLVLTLIWGFALSHADLEFARVYPKAAEDFRRTTGSMESFCAGEWGFRYYLGRAGVPPLPADESRVRGGSFLALPKLALPYDIPVSLRAMMVPVQTFAYKPKTPLRILDRQSAAGFYSSGWGLIPFSFSGRNLEEIQVQQTNFMVERLPWAQITGKSRIRPWPGFLTLQGQSFPAILVKSGTRILYPMKLREPVSLELLYGISPDAYNGGGENEFNFEVRQLEADGSVLAASRLSLHPGVKPEDRNWHPLKLSLKRTAGGILDFGFACGSIECPGTGAFAQAVLRPAEP